MTPRSNRSSVSYIALKGLHCYGLILSDTSWLMTSQSQRFEPVALSLFKVKCQNFHLLEVFVTHTRWSILPVFQLSKALVRHSNGAQRALTIVKALLTSHRLAAACGYSACSAMSVARCHGNVYILLYRASINAVLEPRVAWRSKTIAFYNYITIFWPTGWPQKWHHILYALTLPNINRFSQLFHCQNQEKKFSNTITIKI